MDLRVRPCKAPTTQPLKVGLECTINTESSGGWNDAQNSMVCVSYKLSTVREHYLVWHEWIKCPCKHSKMRKVLPWRTPLLKINSGWVFKNVACTLSPKLHRTVENAEFCQLAKV